MTNRYRSMMDPVVNGSIVEKFHRSDWDEYEYSSYSPKQRYTEDLIDMPRNGNLFKSETWTVHSGEVSGKGILAGTSREVVCDKFLIPRYGYNPNSIRTLMANIGPNVTDSDLQYEYTRFVNQTSPARAESNVPVALLELREVPSLIRSAKDLINVRKWRTSKLNQLSDAWLSWSFGISPMLSDLDTILTLPQLINRRFEELRRLRDRGYKKSTRGLLQYTREPSVSENTFSQSWPFRIDTKETTSIAHSAWGHVIWTCETLKHLSDNQLVALARAKLVDGDISINDLWELVPWSWLADYFASVGDYLGYIGNTIPGLVDRGSVMCRTNKYLIAEVLGDPVPGITFPQIVLSYERKYRLPGAPGNYVSQFDVLSRTQLANISAVVASSKRGYTRSD